MSSTNILLLLLSAILVVHIAKSFQLSTNFLNIALQRGKNSKTFQSTYILRNSADKDSFRPSYQIKDLLDSGFHPFEMMKPISKSSYYSSRHDPISQMHIDEFSALDNIQQYFAKRGLNDTSMSLRFFGDHEYVRYSNENDVQAIIELFLTDLLVVLGYYRRDITLVREQSMIGDSEADIWVIMKSGRPISVIEVKTPGPGKLDNHKISGHLFDYMVRLRSFYGQCETFGIVTTLEDWRICWFPDTHDAAASTSLIGQQPVHYLTSHYAVGQSLTSSRKLEGSRVMKLWDKSLIPAMLSLFVKSVHSNHRPIPLFSNHRVYHTLTRNSFLWQKLPSHASATNISLELPKSNTDSFMVLRHFHPGADGRVVLCVNSGMRLSIMKFHKNPDDCVQEENRWATLYNERVWTFNRTLEEENTERGLVLPFVFPCCERYNDRYTERTIFFKFDIAAWCKEGDFVDAEDSTMLNDFTSSITRIYEAKGWNPMDVANIAIEDLAKKGMVHDDLEWRHVALMPVLKGDKCVDLKPIFIDLVRMSAGYTYDEALSKMQKQLQEISIGCNFSDA